MTIKQVEEVIKREFVREGVGSTYIDLKLNIRMHRVFDSLYIWKNWRPNRLSYSPNNKPGIVRIYLL